MKIVVVVDANVIMSALLGGKPSIILFDGNFQFATTEFTLNEVKKYFPRLIKKTGITEAELVYLLGELPIKIYRESFYHGKLKQAENIIGHIDKKDIDILSLALQMESYLWSQDKHFVKADFPKLLKTEYFL